MIKQIFNIKTKKLICLINIIFCIFNISLLHAEDINDSNVLISEFNQPSEIIQQNITKENNKKKQDDISISFNSNLESSTQISVNTLLGNKYEFSSNKENKLLKSISSVRIEPKLKLKFNSIDTTAVFSANIASSSYMGSQNLRQAIREAYIRYSTQNIDISLGRQLFNYGKTDILTIQDQFAPRDVTWQGDIYQKSQLGELALKSEIYLNDNFTLTNALIAQDNGYTLPNEVKIQLKPLDYYTLGHKPYVAGLARIDYRKDNIELGISLSRGVNPMPAINVNKFKIDYIPEWRASIDGSYAFNQAIWRYDINYAQADINKNDFLGFSHKRIIASTGIDASLWQDTKLLLQAIYRYEFDFYNNPSNFLAYQNQKLSYGFEKHQYYLSATYKQSINSKHNIEFSHLIGKNQSLTTAKYSYKIKDGLELNMKGQYIATKDNNSILGQIKPKKHMYFDISYYF